MHVWTLRLSFRKIAAAAAALSAVIFVIVCGAVLGAARKDDFDGSTTERRILFLQERGIEADPGSEEARQIVIPAEFDEVYKKYADYQTGHGFFLWHYAGMRAEVYSYTVTNAPNNRRDIRANLLTYDETVIGYDLFDPIKSEYMAVLE
ncbi:MAG: DUF4830 domain-containing protein [Oscillospiraceae bacterium]|nr:DUF4830 domain-containing protein [Oscillospiraceae bacterium]